GLMLKQWRYALLAGLALAITLCMSACGSTTTASGGNTPTASANGCVSGNLVVGGSTALQPLVTKVAKDYTTRCTGATITVQGGGSSVGKANVETGSFGIGNSDTPASAAQSDLVDHQIAVVIFGVIVNSDAGITNLTTAQLQGIYAGTITNWSQAGGKRLPIIVVSRPTSSGTRATFAQYVLGHNERVTGPSHLVTDSTGQVIQEVAQTSGAIGYAATGQVPTGSAAMLVSIDGKAANTSSVENNTYKFWNIEHMYTKGQPSPLARALIDYMDSDQGHAEEA